MHYFPNRRDIIFLFTSYNVILLIFSSLKCLLFLNQRLVETTESAFIFNRKLYREIKCCISPPVVVILNVYKYSLCPQHMSGMHLPTDMNLGTVWSWDFFWPMKCEWEVPLLPLVGRGREREL